MGSTESHPIKIGYEYAYDDIGNRLSSKAGGDETGMNLRAASYTPNLLNQYASRTTPGYLEVLGEASTAYVAPAAETFTPDLDGNLTQDARWVYTWDAENRLISMQSQSSVPDAQKRRLVFEYDWQSRRTGKKVFVYSGGAYPANPNAYTKFLYQGWNLVRELDGNNANATLRSYTWGLDLSGSPQGAGGVGGLLAINDTANGQHFAAYDGNGNLMTLNQASLEWVNEKGSHSHVLNFVQDYTGPGNKAYLAGPFTSGWGTASAIKEGYNFICSELSNNRSDPVFLVGHSRGGLVAIQIAWKLMKGCPCIKGPIEVQFMGLYDAVSMQLWNWAGPVPDNVKFVAHGIRDSRVGSRPWWGNTGLTGGQQHVNRAFFGTHSAMGGDPFHGDFINPRGQAAEELASIQIDMFIHFYALKQGATFGGWSL